MPTSRPRSAFPTDAEHLLPQPSTTKPIPGAPLPKPARTALSTAQMTTLPGGIILHPLPPVSKPRRAPKELSGIAAGGGNGAGDATREGALASNHHLQNGSTLPLANSNTTGIQWTTLPPSTLHLYRHHHHLLTPSSQTSFNATAILTDPRSLGRYSPSMAVPRHRRRVPREELARAVRKSFNAMPVQEGECVVEFMYRVREGGRGFRLRFGQQGGRIRGNAAGGRGVEKSGEAAG